MRSVYRRLACRRMRRAQTETWLLLFFNSFESDGEQRLRVREKERREDVGEKKIKRGRLGGGAHEGEALCVLMLILEGPSCHHDVHLQSLPVRRGSLQSIPSLHRLALSHHTHPRGSNIPSVHRIQRNIACKQRETRTRLTLFAATPRDVKWSFGMAIQILLITNPTVQYCTYMIP